MTGIFRRFRFQGGAWEAITMLVIDFECGRIRDVSGSKPTRKVRRNSLLPMHFPLRAFLCGAEFEHRERWIEDRLQTLAECFAATVCGFAVMDNRLHGLLPLEPDAANGWLDEDVVRRWLVANESRNQPIAARDWLGSQRSIGPKPSCRGASRNIRPGNPPRWPCPRRPPLQPPVGEDRKGCHHR